MDGVMRGVVGEDGGYGEDGETGACGPAGFKKESLSCLGYFCRKVRFRDCRLVG